MLAGENIEKIVKGTDIKLLNRHGKKFDWDNDDMEKISAAVEQPKLIKPDLIAEIPGIDVASDYDRIIGPTPRPTLKPRERTEKKLRRWQQ